MSPENSAFRKVGKSEIAAAVGERMEFLFSGAVLRMVARYFQVPESHITGKRTGRRDERGMAL
jgi:hypothetical protein